MKLLQTIVLGMALATSLSATAAVEETPEAVPMNLHVYDQVGNTYVDLLLTEGQNHVCGGRYYISPYNANYNAVFSTLLAAQTAGKKVVLRVDGCNPLQQGTVIGVYLK